MTGQPDADPTLPPPAAYFPVQAGPYVMKAGLARLDTGFGNGAADACAIQLDRQWPRYRANKLRARAESLDKYYCLAQGCDAGTRRAVAGWLLDTLLREYPNLFRLQRQVGGTQRLHCLLSGDRLQFDTAMDLIAGDGGNAVQPPYRDSLDALACQIQEDLSVVNTEPEGHGQVTMLHLCAPNHWAAAQRIGRSFQEAHAPVPKFERIARHTGALLANLRDGGPYVRFAWGLATDQRLNHHPAADPGWADPGSWHGRRFEPAQPALFLRVERQLLAGLAANRSILFAIRTYFTDVRNLRPQQQRTLAAALRAMDPEIARYKGLAEQREPMARWLLSLAAAD